MSLALDKVSVQYFGACSSMAIQSFFIEGNWEMPI
jgi:hypothetical protein